MLPSSQQQALSLQRLKSIQKSTNHVNNLVQNAKKMIYNQQQLSFSEKEILQVKISIEKDHLQKVFCKIDCPDDEFNVSIVRKQQNLPKDDGSIKEKNYNEYHQKLIELEQKRQPTASITISRYLKQQPGNDRKQYTPQNHQVSVYSNEQEDRYEINLSDENIHETVFIKPSKTSKVVVNTRTQFIDQRQQQSQKSPTKSYFLQNQRLNANQQYAQSFSSYRKQRQEIINDQLSQKSSIIQDENASHFYQDQILINTPKNQLKIVSTQTQQKLFEKPKQKNQQKQQHLKKKKSPKTQMGHFNQVYPNPVSSYENYKFKEKLRESELSTQYKEILYRNKEKLESARQKVSPYPQTPNKSKSPQYQLYIDKLLKKKSQSKKRLYGPTFEASSKQTVNSLISTTKKYSIANSHKISKISDSRSKNNSSRKSLSVTKNNQTPLSSARKSPLHSTTIKSYHSPCQKCIKCKSTLANPKPHQQTFEQFYLVKKYLTPEGEQQCYNFLRAQGIPEKDWGSYVTEYVYRQLSRVYQENKQIQHYEEEGTYETRI